MLLACNYSHIMLSIIVSISPIEMLILSTFNKTGKSTCTELQTYQRVLTLQNCSQLIAHFSIQNANNCWLQNICFYYEVRVPDFFIYRVDPLQTPQSFCSTSSLYSWPLALGQALMEYSLFSTYYSILLFLNVLPIILFILPIIHFIVPIILIKSGQELVQKKQ